MQCISASERRWHCEMQLRVNRSILDTWLLDVLEHGLVLFTNFIITLLPRSIVDIIAKWHGLSQTRWSYNPVATIAETCRLLNAKSWYGTERFVITQAFYRSNGEKYYAKKGVEIIGKIHTSVKICCAYTPKNHINLYTS